MRQIILDTETTGLSSAQGHRIIELGCVELLHRRITGATFHTYLQPDRPIDAAAQRVHGITEDFLRDKPRFKDIVQEFKKFIKGAELIIHNAAFDVSFIENEFFLINDNEWYVLEKHCQITDTLLLAKQKHPGQKNKLDALCKRYGINNSHRDKHGALLDAHILAEVYLAMTGGQTVLSLDNPTIIHEKNPSRSLAQKPLKDSVVHFASEQELAHHHSFLNQIKETSKNLIWEMDVSLSS